MAAATASRMPSTAGVQPETAWESHLTWKSKVAREGAVDAVRPRRPSQVNFFAGGGEVRRLAPSVPARAGTRLTKRARGGAGACVQSLWYLSRMPQARDRQGLAQPPPYLEVREGTGVRTGFAAANRRSSGPIAGWDSKRDPEQEAQRTG